MRSQIRYAAIAAVAILLSLASVPAEAQRFPGGSYLRSCTNVRMFGNRLVADCRRKNGSWNRTALNIRHCDGGIANINGHLTCNFAGPGFGSSRPRPFGWNR